MATRLAWHVGIHPKVQTVKRTLLIVGLALNGAALAQGHSHGAAAPAAGNANAVERQPSRPYEEPRLFAGEVRGLDKASAKVTLTHEAISVFDVPAKTAEYSVKDAAMLDHLHPGDRVRFTAVLQGRALVITRIVAAR